MIIRSYIWALNEALEKERDLIFLKRRAQQKGKENHAHECIKIKLLGHCEPIHPLRELF